MEKWNSQKYAEFTHQLRSLANEKYKTFHSRLVPEGLGSMIGVRTPELKKAAKNIVKTTDWESFLQTAGFSTYEETLVQGFVIGFSKAELQTRLEYLKEFIPHINNWAVCDMTASSFKFKKHEAQTVLSFIMPYFKSEMEYEVRFAVVLLMDYFVTDEYIDMVLETYSKIKSSKYYINMAVAWGISVCFVKFPQKTAELFESGVLDRFTHNKAIQKITESNRVDIEAKALVRFMKRKK